MAEWRPIPVEGYEQYYSVSDEGQVRREKPGCGTRVGLILKPRFDSDGYVVVVLWKWNIRKDCKVHQAVLGAFVGAPPFGFTVNHKDGIKKNNLLSNLEYVSIAQNNLHAWRNLPRRPHKKSTHCRRGHLFTEENIITEKSGRRCRICRMKSRARPGK